MRNRFLWIFWIAATLIVAGMASARLYVGGDRTAFLPGDTTGVHHQIEVACETCHTSKPFASQAKIRKDINKTCVSCHKTELKASNDSHPISKFKNPRMADYWDRIDARFCTSCHSEHQPEITLAGLVTLPGDFCVACHSQGEQDVRVNRPTHAELEFDTCASSGCHNFHDNRALYEDFLVKHAGAPAFKEAGIHPIEAIARTRPRAGDTAEIEAYLTKVAAPDTARDIDIETHWAASAHAAADVGCGGCHAPKSETEEEVLANWVDAPEEAVCTSCHRAEFKTFALGRHGMRQHPELAKPRRAKTMLKRLGMDKPSDGMIAAVETYLADATPPDRMSTPEARVALHPATDETLTCNTCHDPHEQDISFAAVGACLSCHADDHSTEYKNSPHFQLWQAELDGTGAPGSGVTCATCHMPKSERNGVVTTNHNQNDTLRPNEKMIRPVCMECHSLEFAIDALADPALIANNFSGAPDRHIDSIDWAVSRVNQPDEDSNQ